MDDRPPTLIEVDGRPHSRERHLEHPARGRWVARGRHHQDRHRHRGDSPTLSVGSGRFGMASDWGLLFIRVVVGFFIFGHGTMKLFGWFGGSGLQATIDAMGTRMRLRPAAPWGVLAGLTEAGGGLLFALGLL